MLLVDLCTQTESRELQPARAVNKHRAGSAAHISAVRTKNLLRTYRMPKNQSALPSTDSLCSQCYIGYLEVVGISQGCQGLSNWTLGVPMDLEMAPSRTTRALQIISKFINAYCTSLIFILYGS